MVGPVEIAHVVDDVLAVLIVEVDVDIGHLHAFGRQEAFEQQPVVQRFQVSDAHRVRADGACGRPASRADADAVVLRPADVFLHDEEVGGKSLLDDDAGFVFVSLDHVGARGAQLVHRRDLAVVAVAVDEPLLALLAEEHLLGVAFGQRETRKD